MPVRSYNQIKEQAIQDSNVQKQNFVSSFFKKRWINTPNSDNLNVKIDP
jgi:hypothetical protein